MSDPFADFAKKVETDSKKKQTGGTGTFQFEEIHHTGLESDRPKIVRAIGGVPDSGETPFTAITRRISWIIGDNGKKFRVVLPDRSENEDHLLWKIIAAVNETTYVNKKKVFIHETKNPELFRMVNKNGLDPTDKKAMFDNGWMGKTKLLMNVIDRERMDWHRENKHTLMLAKSVNSDGDRTFVDEGVPSFGFTNLLATGIFKFYKDWRNYDIGITKTGLKETPYRIINASKYFEELPEDLQALVVSGPMTAEELSWEAYDLTKLFKYTSMTKVYDKLKLSIQKIDARLGTRFDKLFQEAIEKEVAAREASKPAESNDADVEEENVSESTSDVTPAVTPAPTRSRSKSVASTELDTSSLAGWSLLTDDERNQITSVGVERGQTVIGYDTTSELLKCGKCGVPSPSDFHACPSCGDIFS